MAANSKEKMIDKAIPITTLRSTEAALLYYAAGTSYGKLCGTSDPSVLIELSN
jgi:hypothetical protein